MSERAKDLTGRILLLLLSSYGLLYFSYKYLIPWSGTNDFQHYYLMYRSPLDLSVTPAPFVLRQVSAVLTYIVWKLHIYYPNQIWFQDPAYDQHVFFAALFTNWVCLIAAGFVSGLIAEKMLGRQSFFAGLLAGYLCLFAFHTQFVVISGITEGVSWLMLALAFLAYLRRNELAVAVILLFAIFQREALLVAMACISCFDLARSHRTDVGRRIRIVLYSCLCLGCYVVLRRHVPGNDHQVEVPGIMESLKRIRLSRAMLTLSFLNQNIVMIAIATRILVWRSRRAEMGSVNWLSVLLASFAVVAFGAVCAGLDVDIGRIAGITIPLFAASAAADILRLNCSEECAPGE